MDLSTWAEERIDNMIQELEEWMTLVAPEEDWLTTEDDDIVEMFGSKKIYLKSLIEWVYDHVCPSERSNVSFWTGHGFTEEEARELSE